MIFISLTLSFEYVAHIGFAADGGSDANIEKLDDISDDDCKLVCDGNMECTGLVTSPIERACWLKRGDEFKSTITEYHSDDPRKAANTYEKIIPVSDPAIPAPEDPAPPLFDGNLVGYTMQENQRSMCCNTIELQGTEDFCKAECDKSGDCTGFEFHTLENRCWLKHDQFLDALQDCPPKDGIIVRLYKKELTPSLPPPEYKPIEVDGTWAFPEREYLKANECFHKTVLGGEELVIPVIFLQRGGPSDDENRDYLEMITEKFHDNGAPFTFEFLKKVEIEAGLPDAAAVADKYRDQLIDDHTILNIFQSFKADGSHSSLGLQGRPYYQDIIQMEQKTAIFNLFSGNWEGEFNAVHEVGHWLGLSHTFEGGCQDGIYGDHVDDTPAVADNRGDGTNGFEKNKDSCSALPGEDYLSNFMDYDEHSTFTPGQIFRMLNTFHFRKFGTIFDYSLSPEYIACMDAPYVPENDDDGNFLDNFIGLVTK